HNAGRPRRHRPLLHHLHAGRLLRRPGLTGFSKSRIQASQRSIRTAGPRFKPEVVMVSPGSRFLRLVALAAALYAGPAFAQNGRISGVVRGAGGVAASGAAVRATNQATGATSRTTTAADGSYTVSNLAPGAYLDEVPSSLSRFTPDLDLFDVSRVEVLRGPEGRLSGAG